MSGPNALLRTSDAGIALIKRFDTIAEADAIELLRRDLAIAEAAVRRLITVPLSQSQFDALVSFTFNVGEGALEKSTLRRRINQGNWALAKRELLRWVYADGKKLEGVSTETEGGSEDAVTAETE